MNNEIEQRLNVLEGLTVEQDEALNGLPKKIIILASPDESQDSPQVKILKQEIQRIDHDIKTCIASSDLVMQLHKKRKTVYLKIVEDMLARCVFEIDGVKYRLIVPAIFLEGKRLTAPEIMADQRLLLHLVAKGSGAIEFA